MDQQKFIDNLKEFYEEADPETVHPEANFRDINGYSSLVAFLIINLVNEEFNVDFTAEDLRRSKTIEDILTIVKSKQ